MTMWAAAAISPERLARCRCRAEPELTEAFGLPVVVQCLRSTALTGTVVPATQIMSFYFACTGAHEQIHLLLQRQPHRTAQPIVPYIQFKTQGGWHD